MTSRIKYKYLVHRHKDRIFSYASWMVKNRQDAEDITQEVLVKIWDHADSINADALHSWITRTTHNLCIDYLRKRQMRNKYEQRRDDEAQELPDEKAPEISEEMHHRMVDDHVRSAIDKLPELQQKALILYEIEGYKYKEICTILDIPINSVKVNIFRARQFLQSELRRYREEL